MTPRTGATPSSASRCGGAASGSRSRVSSSARIASTPATPNAAPSSRRVVVVGGVVFFFFFFGVVSFFFCCGGGISAPPPKLKTGLSSSKLVWYTAGLRMTSPWSFPATSSRSQSFWAAAAGPASGATRRAPLARRSEKEDASRTRDNSSATTEYRAASKARDPATRVSSPRRHSQLARGHTSPPKHAHWPRAATKRTRPPRTRLAHSLDASRSTDPAVSTWHTTQSPSGTTRGLFAPV
mmetsp:Transcript_11291/g.33811  ORF Transcript_11291/g.33811 Transcript_11291/m.33811 type:complete len:239 (+) Transcript_11291:631-1347(+)